MANPFITTAAPTTVVDPDSQALQKSRQYAAMLLQQNNQPQGKMVGGHFVPPSWTQQLNSALNPILGGYMMNKADEAQLALQEKQRQETAQGLMEYNRLRYGQQGTADVVPQGQTLRDDDGNLTYGSQVGTPNVEANPAAAYAYALRSKSPTVYNMAMEMLKPQKLGEGERIVTYNPNTGKEEVVMQGGEKYHAPVQTDMGDRIRLEYANGKVEFVPKNLSSKDIMQGRFEGWYTGGGMPNVNNFGGSATGGANTVQVPKGDEKYLPKDIPQYVYDSSITPKANMENAAKFSVENQNNVKNAKNSFGVIKEAANILNSNAPSSGRGENIITGAREFFGGGGETSKADAQLKILGTKLTMQQPRFEGPQSDKDTAMYQAAAGDIGNPNIPIATRVASLKTMIDLSKKYYPNGDWDSVDLSGPVIKKNFLGGTVGLGARPLTAEEKKSEQTGQWRVK